MDSEGSNDMSSPPLSPHLSIPVQLTTSHNPNPTIRWITPNPFVSVRFEGNNNQCVCFLIDFVPILTTAKGASHFSSQQIVKNPPSLSSHPWSPSTCFPFVARSTCFELCPGRNCLHTFYNRSFSQTKKKWLPSEKSTQKPIIPRHHHHHPASRSHPIPVGSQHPMTCQRVSTIVSCGWA